MRSLEDLLSQVDMDELLFEAWDEHRPVAFRLASVEGDHYGEMISAVDYTLGIGLLLGAAMADGEEVSLATVAAMAGAVADAELFAVRGT